MNASLVWPVSVPLLGAVLCIVWPRRSNTIANTTGAFILVAAVWLLYRVYESGPLIHALGGWSAGLGIALRADGLSAVLLLMTAIISMAVSTYASIYFREPRTRARFWPLWLLMWCSLNALFLSGDLFNLYVTLELMGLTAVSLAIINDERESLRAALRYLLVGLLGSMAYLAGVALLYTRYGSLDLLTVSQALQAEPAAWVALSIMTIGLLLKTAMFPLHFWLPPAHANAAAPVSAALSALVVKAAFYLILRLWLDLFDQVATPLAANLLGVLGGSAVLWGSWQAIRAERLKLLAAYSTIAQLGYLVLFFPLIFALPQGVARDAALAGLVLMALAHGFAKSALFLSAGIIQHHGGHDRIAEMHSTVQALPATSFTMALAGVVLIGLPPSGAFLGKWELISGSVYTGQWLIVVVVSIGSMLAAVYVFRLISRGFGTSPYPKRTVLIEREEIPALVLAIFAVVLGLGVAPPLWKLLGFTTAMTAQLLPY
jgi:formate hydrogenlyase subunit 3/multisubunit Na+/H+ antiporter MnhD subunit